MYFNWFLHRKLYSYCYETMPNTCFSTENMQKCSYFGVQTYWIIDLGIRESRILPIFDQQMSSFGALSRSLSKGFDLKQKWKSSKKVHCFTFSPCYSETKTLNSGSKGIENCCFCPKMFKKHPFLKSFRNSCLRGIDLKQRIWKKWSKSDQKLTKKHPFLNLSESIFKNSLRGKSH